MWTWAIEYHNNERFLALYEQERWSVLAEILGVMLIQHGFSYPLGNWLLGKTETGIKKIHHSPMTVEMLAGINEERSS